MKSIKNKSITPKKVPTIKPRKRQKTFKNEELSINKIKKEYEKFKLPSKPSKRLP